MAFNVSAPDLILKEGIFIQPLTPIGNSLIASFFVGIIPLVLVLVLLGVFRVPAYYASFAGLVLWYKKL